MLRSNSDGMLKTGLLISFLILFCLGCFFLLDLRFKKGESFPEYSSLRADPLGTKVFFESLQRLKYLQVSRNYQCPEKVSYTKSVLIFLDINPDLFIVGSVFTRYVETLLRRENRVVISFSDRQLFGSELLKSSYNSDDSVDFNPGIRFKSEPVKTSETTNSVDIFKGMLWPGSLQLFSDSTWCKIVTRDSSMVLGEKNVQKGELIILNNGYNLCNQGLQENNKTILSNPLIPYCIGTFSTIIFDEWHHGIVKRMGVSALVQKFGFTPVIVFFIIWFLLLAWYINGYNTKVCIPETNIADESETDSLLLLLSSKISETKIIETCKQEWKNSFPSKEIPVEDGKNTIEKYNSLFKKLTKNKT
jgi:hypothetical protein